MRKDSIEGVNFVKAADGRYYKSETSRIVATEPHHVAGGHRTAPTARNLRTITARPVTENAVDSRIVNNRPSAYAKGKTRFVNRTTIRKPIENGTAQHPMVNSDTAPRTNDRRRKKSSTRNHGNRSRSPEPSANNRFTGNQPTKASSGVENHTNTTAPKNSAIPVSSLDNRFYLNIEIKGKPFAALVDPGAVISFLGPRPASLVSSAIAPTGMYMIMPNGSTENLQGEVDLTLEIDGMARTVTFKVSDSLNYDIILGIDVLEKFEFVINFTKRTWQTSKGIEKRFYPKDKDPGVLNSVTALEGVAELSNEQRKRLDALLRRLLSPSEGPLEAAKVTAHKIDVQGATPIRQRLRRISPKLLSAVNEEIDRMLREGIIEPSESPWCSCPVIVPKGDGKIRFCVDYRSLNHVTKKDAYPLPHMDMLLDNLRNARYLSKIDLRQAYHQIPLDPASREYTAFAIQGKGLFQFRRLPYGLSNAPASFQRAMDAIFGPAWQPYVFVYMDDIIVSTETFEEHLVWLEKTLKKLKEIKLQVNPDKCDCGVPEVKYLGYVINKDGLKTNSEKIDPILNYPTPRNLKQLRRFIGMVGWYARFIKDLSSLKVPLNELLKKDVSWHWGEPQQRAFEKLLLSLTQAPVLARPDPNIPFCLQTDASNVALGAVLTQNIDGEEHPIAFASRALTKAEKNYTVTERECLAVLWAVEKFRGYLLGEKFTVITDHSSLRWLHNLKDPTGRLARWATALQAYDMEIIHRKGALHKVPDALSRAFEEECGVAAATTIDLDKWYVSRREEVRNYPGRFPDWKIEDDRLYINRPNSLVDPIVPDLDSWKLVVPRVNRKRVLFESHNTPQAGHLGIDKTIHRVAQSFYWPGMRKDIAQYVRNCVKCQLHKVSQQAPMGLMGKREIEGPWTTVAGDVMGPFPPSKSGFRYVVVFQDLFTKYVEVRPLRKSTAHNIVKAFEELVVFRWGCPKFFVTDNGTEFSNRFVTAKMGEYGTVQTTIAPYHAQANPTERSNRTLKSMMSIFVGEDHRDWDLHLHEFAFAINTTEHSSTMLSPSFLNFGRNPRPLKVLTDDPDTPVLLQPGNPQLWADRLQRLPALYDLVRKHLDKANDRQARYYNRNRRNIVFNVGDKVVRRNRVLSSAADKFAAKLASKFTGPCRIEKVLSPVVYQLRDLEDNRVSKVHISDLKPFSDQDHLVTSIPPGLTATHDGESRGKRSRSWHQGQATPNSPTRAAHNTSTEPQRYSLRPRAVGVEPAGGGEASQQPRRRGPGRPRNGRQPAPVGALGVPGDGNGDSTGPLDPFRSSSATSSRLTIPSPDAGPSPLHPTSVLLLPTSSHPSSRSSSRSDYRSLSRSYRG